MQCSFRAFQILRSCVGKSSYAFRSIPSSLLHCRCVSSVSTKGAEGVVRHSARDLEKWNIEAQCPELIKFWHPTKNGSLRPSTVSVRSTEKIWWKCGRGPDHEWFVSPRTMYNPESKSICKCPFCDNRRVSVTNSLSTLYPEIAAQWHPTRNGDVHPSAILPTSSYKAWWKCDKGENHVWQRVVAHRTKPRSVFEDKCPFCMKVDRHSQSLAVCRPDLAKEWDYSRNGGLTPEMVSKSSAKKVWWMCEKGHHYQCAVYNRGSTHNTGCPICSCHQVNAETCIANYRHLLDFLDPVNNKGSSPHSLSFLDVDVNHLSVMSHKQLQWRCPESEYDLTKKHHVWRCSVYDMEYTYKEECPFCSQVLKSNGDEMSWSDLQLSSNVNTYYRPRVEKKKKKGRTEKGRKRRIPIRDVDALIELMNSV